MAVDSLDDSNCRVVRQCMCAGRGGLRAATQTLPLSLSLSCSCVVNTRIHYCLPLLSVLHHRAMAHVIRPWRPSVDGWQRVIAWWCVPGACLPPNDRHLQTFLAFAHTHKHEDWLRDNPPYTLLVHIHTPATHRKRASDDVVVDRGVQHQ